VKCPKCGSDQVTIQAVTESKLVDKHRGCMWWLFIGWWWIPIKWLFLTLPALIFAIFGHKKQKIKTKIHSEAVCQSCGHRWRV
jgi:DNA-directed RNA polymerase subunit M/transcription elongation factor TFIIS